MSAEQIDWRQWVPRALLGVALILLLASQPILPVASAPAGNRTICFHHTHTLEDGCFTFRKNGAYDSAVLRQLNIFLADWRTHEPTKMDPALFDLIWEIYQDVHATQPVNIVSSYRTPKTNAMLRAKSSAVAENSQHMLGKAMDIFIPGVDLSRLRATAMRHQVGGVGFYPTSGSPFVHVDTGSVRAWPRMTTAQLKKVFPDGKTLHLPVDGKPLSDKGRAYAMAEWNKCHEVPCGGLPTTIAPQPDEPEIMVASLDPAPRSVAAVDVENRFPAPRPDFLAGFPDQVTANVQLAPIPARKSVAMLAATGTRISIAAPDALNNEDQLLPEPRVLMTPRNDEVLTAYAPEIVPDAGAQRALEMLIERETTAALGAQPEAEVASIDPGELRPGTSETVGVDVIKNIFDLTWTAVTEAGARSSTASALAGNSAIPTIDGLAMHRSEFTAPEIDHVDETLGTPERISTIHYAELYEPEGYLDREAELGPFASRIVFESNLTAPEPYDRFVQRPPLLIGTH